MQGQQQRQWGIEQLEKREVMAGNVLAAVMGGNLNLIGGSSDNQVAVSEVGDRVFKVEGFSGTTVNGKSGGLFYAANDHLIANMGAGNDTLIIASETWRRTDFASIDVNMGQGHDTCYLWSTTVYGGAYSTRIVMGDNGDYGFDRFEMGASGNHYATSIWNSMSLVMGGGNDVAVFRGGNVNYTLSISMGNDHDWLQFDRCGVDRLMADLGDGNDTISTWGLNARFMYVDAGYGHDTYSGHWNWWNSNFQCHNFEVINLY